MSQLDQNSVNAAKEIVKVPLGAKLIDCPEHPGQQHALLFIYPHHQAGIWECPIDKTSDVHDHYEAINDGRAEIEVMEGETWPTGPNNSGHRYSYYICAGEEGCGVELEGDPEIDRLEAQYDD